jgi:hypothetical protein
MEVHSKKLSVSLSAPVTPWFKKKQRGDAGNNIIGEF